MSLIEKLKSDKPFLALAPLAGYTDVAFRCVVKELGADMTVSEMISSDALIQNSKKTLKMIKKAKNETPYIVQISGNKIDKIKEAVFILNDIDGIDGIDLNCGCPAKKVYHHGSGARLLEDLPKLEMMLSTIKKHSNKTYTSAKVRIGIEKKIGADIVNSCQNSGADFVAVHGRTKVGAYKSKVDYEQIAIMKELSRIPIIANGDITSYDIAKKVTNETKADGLMIGRGAVVAPWIFQQIKNNTQTIEKKQKKTIILNHLDSIIDIYGEYGVVLFRKYLHGYSKSYDGSAVFRQEVNKINSSKKMRHIVSQFF
ncbi:MAG: tRNA dihydrouridine synthase DusB [Epsilonproteobacteria bacterium]|nr:MAG: tRNA dihydrouridine synthase DusB [Campylobacterota bacterium]